MTFVPDVYPFPDDEVIYCTAREGFDPDGESFTAIARLPDDHEMFINGVKHHNTHRLTVYTPLRGPVSFLTRPLDGEGFGLAALRLLAEDGDGPTPTGELKLNRRWLESHLGIPVEFTDPMDPDEEGDR